MHPLDANNNGQKVSDKNTKEKQHKYREMIK